MNYEAYSYESTKVCGYQEVWRLAYIHSFRICALNLSASTILVSSTTKTTYKKYIPGQILPSHSFSDVIWIATYVWTMSACGDQCLMTGYHSSLDTTEL